MIPNIFHLDHRPFRTRTVAGFAVVILLILISSIGCAKRGRERVIPPAEEAWQKAMNYFEREKYYQAQQLLRDYVLNYSGSSQVDSAQFYLGRSTFELDDYLTAAEEFKRVVSQYPFSKLVGDAAFWEARSYYEQAPSYQLDQTYTQQALETFQRFLEDNPDHPLSDSGYDYIARCREKLAHKQYAAAKLYFDLNEYASAVLYADHILSNYYDTPWADPAQYLKARSFNALDNRSRALQEYESYLNKFPNGKNADSARRAVNALSEYRSAQKPPDLQP